MEDTARVSWIGVLDERWRALAVGFLVEKSRRTGSRRTTEMYGRTIARFLRELSDPVAVGPLDVHAFAYGLGPSGRLPSASTIAVRLAAVSGFYDFAVRMEVLERNPAAAVRRPVVRQGPPRGLTVAEIDRLLAAIPMTPSGLLDRAITITALLTGLRRSELLDLHVIRGADDDPPHYEVVTKGGTVRRRELPAPAWNAIESARDALGTPTLPADGRAFDIAAATYYVHLRRYGEAAGLGRISPHVLRHTAAKLRRAAGATIEEVSGFLGHESIATTAVYLRRLEDERDVGWQPVAAALGLTREVGRDLAGIDMTDDPTASGRPVHIPRQDGRGNDRPAHRIGGVHAPLPQRDATTRVHARPGRRPTRRRARRRRAARARRAGPEGELSALRRRTGVRDRGLALACPRAERRR